MAAFNDSFQTYFGSSYVYDFNLFGRTYHVTAQADLPEENLVFFSVPYDEGFTALVDSEKVSIEIVDGGLMAVPVPAGRHSIEFTSYPAGLSACKILSAVSFMAFIILIIRKMSASGKQMSLH